MRKPYLSRTLYLLVGLLLLAACSGPEPTALPQPGATPLPATATSAPPASAPPTSAPPTDTPLPPTATPEPTPTPAPETSLPGDWVVFTDGVRGLVLSHPPAWEVMPPDKAELEKLLTDAEAGMTNDAIQAILQQLNSTPGALDAFAALGFFFDDPTIADHNFVSNFTAIVAPADGLTLETYAELVGDQLRSVDGVTLHSGEVLGGLRPGGLDVASLRYSMDGPVVYGLPEDTQIDGWQVVLYDTDADRLLILSLTGIADNFPAMEDMFRTLIYHLEFN